GREPRPGEPAAGVPGGGHGGVERPVVAAAGERPARLEAPGRRPARGPRGAPAGPRPGRERRRGRGRGPARRGRIDEEWAADFVHGLRDGSRGSEQQRGRETTGRSRSSPPAFVLSSILILFIRDAVRVAQLRVPFAYSLLAPSSTASRALSSQAA